jgi:hypothetical protein
MGAMAFYASFTGTIAFTASGLIETISFVVGIGGTASAIRLTDSISMIGFLDFDRGFGGTGSIISTGACVFVTLCFTTSFFTLGDDLIAAFFAIPFFATGLAAFLMAFTALPLCKEGFVFAVGFFLVPFFFIVAMLASSK